jgi:hypothetical protein
MTNAVTDRSYIHIRIDPKDALEIEGGTRALMRDMLRLATERLGPTAVVSGSASMSPTMRAL